MQLQNQLQRGAAALTGTAEGQIGASTHVAAVELQQGRTVPVTRVLRLAATVDKFLAAHSLEHTVHTHGSEWPYASAKPPTNPATRHAACGVPGAAVIKCWFLAVGAAGSGGDAPAAAETLVWLVGAGSATVNLAAVAKALGVKDTTRIRLANRQQLASSPALCTGGQETDLGKRNQYPHNLTSRDVSWDIACDAVYSAKKFRLGPPLVTLPAPIDVVAMAELFDSEAAAGVAQGQHYVEVGFGRYVIMSSAELRRALAVAAGGGGGAARRVVEVPGLQAPTGQRAQTLA